MIFKIFWNDNYKYPALLIANNYNNKVIKSLGRIEENLKISTDYRVELPLAVVKDDNMIIVNPYSKEIFTVTPYNNNNDYNNIQLPDDLKDYQKKLILELLKRKKAILSLDTGLGKTRIMLELLRILQTNNVLVIVPNKSLISVWEKEKEKWSIQNNIQIINIQSLEKAKIDKIDILIIDEAHEIIKGSMSRKKKSMEKLIKLIKEKQPGRIYLLTATPIVNDLLDDAYGYLTLFDVKNRSIIRASKKDGGIKLDRERREFIAKSILKYYIVREEVNKDLEENIQNIYIEINDERAIRLFEKFIYLLYEVIKYYKVDDELIKFKIMPVISKYVKASYIYWEGFHSDPNNEEINIDHPKVKKLKEILDNLNEKAIVFFYHKNFLRILDALNIKYVAIFGKNSKKIKEIIKQFRENNDIKVLAISIKAGGVGLDFPDINTIIFYEYWWTYVAYKQAKDRIMRMNSQNKKKNIINLVSYLPIRTLEKLEKYTTIDIWANKKIYEKKTLNNDILGVKDAKMSYINELIEEIEKLKDINAKKDMK